MVPEKLLSTPHWNTPDCIPWENKQKEAKLEFVIKQLNCRKGGAESYSVYSLLTPSSQLFFSKSFMTTFTFVSFSVSFSMAPSL